MITLRADEIVYNPNSFGLPSWRQATGQDT